MTELDEKVRCRKCDRPFYKKRLQKFSCPYCARDALIPDATMAVLQLKIRPGGYDDGELCLEAGLASKARSGAIYLRGMVQVLTGPQEGKKFSLPIGILSINGEYWSNKGREIIRGILNSSQGLSPSDMSRKAIYGRVIDSYKVLNGIAFVGLVGISKNRQGRDENILSKVLTTTDREYCELIDSGAFVPSVKSSAPVEENTPEWLRG